MIDGVTLLQYPVQQPLIEYAGYQGLDSTAVSTARAKWNSNSLEIPIPSFAQLFIEQICSPMFVFQGFVMVLYLLDDYWSVVLISSSGMSLEY